MCIILSFSFFTTIPFFLIMLFIFVPQFDHIFFITSLINSFFHSFHFSFFLSFSVPFFIPFCFSSFLPLLFGIFFFFFRFTLYFLFPSIYRCFIFTITRFAGCVMDRGSEREIQFIAFTYQRLPSSPGMD